MRKTFPARRSDAHSAPECHLGDLRRQNPLARIPVFSVFIIYDREIDREIHRSENPRIHRARSKVRDEGLVRFVFFVFGFVTCSLSRTPRPPAKLRASGPINSIPALSRAETNFIRESTLPRMTPSLASMR